MTTSCVEDLGFDGSFTWPLKESARVKGRLLLAGPLGESFLMLANFDFGDWALIAATCLQRLLSERMAQLHCCELRLAELLEP